ncbi:RBM19 [Branchiostoma lanceolatum]|uniref:RBM19 protein n=1 Tax=Branchiostoma lanceolatum TaxID=7740 RepID=A0A8K0EK04_BRALA|nr:RBM19 [Branchiostoma lanceolatum]
MADADEKSSRTLFVRNLPYTTTNEKLEEIFSEAGPIKECFVVREPGVTDTCRGFGFVTFALREDAVKAKDQPVSVQGRKVLVSFADKKPKKRKSEGLTEQEGESEQKDSPEAPPKKKKRTEHSTAGRVVVLKNLPAKVKEEKIQKLVSKYEGVEEVTFPAPDTEVPTALVKFSSNTLARKALPGLGSSKVKSSSVQAVLQSKDNKEPSKKSLKKSRIIVRNLSFKCNKEDLRKTFEKYGKITDVQVPTIQGGKKRGFGFVQFTSVFEAAKAVAEMNTKPLHGRPIAVDYTVPKNRYESAKTPENKVDQEDGESDDDDGDDEDSGTEDRDEAETGDKQEDGSDEEDDDDNDDDDDDGEDDSEDDDDEDSDDFSDDEDDEKVNKKSKTPKPFRESTDVQQGKTVFIRNLSYDSLDEDVEELFLQFGGIKYVRLVVDPQTEHSRGTAFVQFNTKEAADKCVQRATTDVLSLAGRSLTVSIAVSRQQAQKLTEDRKEKKPTDKRNLYLAREGLIRPGTQAATGLTDKDVAMRQKVEKIKREKLKNPAIFVSDVRLCVRNIPLNMGDKDLRRLFLKTLGDKSISVTESRVMRDLKNVNSQGVGKSRGYGFVSFSQHDHALRALRETNNNPNLFPDGRRLIVEFSLENKLALKKQEMRLTKAKAARQSATQNNRKQHPETNGSKQPTNKPPQHSTENNSPQTLSRKQKRKQRQQQRREKIQQEKLDGLDGKFDTSNQQSGVKAVRGTKGLPSHLGPKIRQRDRGKVVQKTLKKPKPKNALTKTKQEPLQQMKGGKGQPPAQPSRRSNKPERKEEAKFDLLVHRYKQKLFGKDSGKQMKKSKWFDG